ncbi:craniofacial development protein 2-like [Coccinella septempunctata]|uniref:craniofacial development protein 2-like n=1 Tax=Coccinella septempunctata TaxID=41139 RepID=UPI001D095831|nr:craniofacial development protein 2-like [Coccinella septempunctata]
MANFKAKAVSVPQVGGTNVNSHTLKKVCLEDSGGGKNSYHPIKTNRKRFQKSQLLYIATYNAKTLSTDEKLLELEEELKNVKWDIIGISEARRIGEGEVVLQSGNTLCYSGEETALRGVGILVHKRHRDKILDVKSISSRVLCLILQINRKYSLKIIQAYAPTIASTDDEFDIFYEDISTALLYGKTYFTLLIGDLNAKVGSKQNEMETAVSYHGLGSRNERGNALIDFAHHNNLYIMNTFFKKRDNKKWTWASPDGKTRNAIDFIISSRKDIINDIDVLNRFSTGSDHRMVRAEIKLNIKKERANMVLKRKSKKWVTPKNTDSYINCISSNLNYEDNMPMDEIYENIRESIKTAIEQFCPKEVKEQKLNQKIRHLMKQRRDMEDKTTQEYSILNRKISREMRKQKRQLNAEKIKSVIEENKSFKLLRKTTMGKREIQKIKDRHGNVVTQKQEIIKSIKLFYQELYTSKHCFIPNPMKIK